MFSVGAILTEMQHLPFQLRASHAKTCVTESQGQLDVDPSVRSIQTPHSSCKKHSPTYIPKRQNWKWKLKPQGRGFLNLSETSRLFGLKEAE